MAAAIIPFIPLIVSAVPQIVAFVEGLFGPKTGPQKFATATTLVESVAKDLAAAGKIPGAPDLTTIQNVIETTVQLMKSQGQLASSPVAMAPAPSPTAVVTRADVQQMLSSLKISAS